jgi:hypothetical protein
MRDSPAAVSMIRDLFRGDIFSYRPLGRSQTDSFFLKPTFSIQIVRSTALPLRSEIPTPLARQTRRIEMSWQVVMDFKIVPTALRSWKSTALIDAIRTQVRKSQTKSSMPFQSAIASQILISHKNQ